jgi:hypothetical protein
MERKSLWKNFLLLTTSSLLALHLNVSQAAESSTSTNPDGESTEECVLEQE